jgi:hypothetical protein
MTTTILFFFIEKNLDFYGGQLRINVIGMVCPGSGQFFAIEVSHSDSATYQAFLDQADKCISLFVKMKKNY